MVWSEGKTVTREHLLNCDILFNINTSMTSKLHYFFLSCHRHQLTDTVLYKMQELAYKHGKLHDFANNHVKLGVTSVTFDLQHGSDRFDRYDIECYYLYL